MFLILCLEFLVLYVGDFVLLMEQVIIFFYCEWRMNCFDNNVQDIYDIRLDFCRIIIKVFEWDFFVYIWFLNNIGLEKYFDCIVIIVYVQ